MPKITEDEYGEWWNVVTDNEKYIYTYHPNPEVNQDDNPNKPALRIEEFSFLQADSASVEIVVTSQPQDFRVLLLSLAEQNELQTQSISTDTRKITLTISNACTAICKLFPLLPGPITSHCMENICLPKPKKAILPQFTSPKNSGNALTNRTVKFNLPEPGEHQTQPATTPSPS